MTSTVPTDAFPPASNTSIPTAEAIHRHLHSYPFESDQEYQAGLAAILGHPETPVTREELAEKADLVLQTQCFYFARKFNLPPIDPEAYSTWLQTHGEPHHLPVAETHPAHSTEQNASATQPSSTQPPTESSSDPEPPYPVSFAAIVDLITRNIPVPGIEEIPDTVLELGSSKVDKTPRRKKPWEKDGEENVGTVADQAILEPQLPAAAAELNSVAQSVDINGYKETGQGVVNILKPNAVPESGLLSKD
ncbi:hypothetical protein A1O1_02356 [Capronia coronata CBS 617.96]|uniref:Uncharacterized protein n=1 Tax=Capronia coronata CBS 617.96 TaxID=1182541 RepID=W9YN48_9EURO|nr:uncharacterized protein A1O1_02356 [Capronia coronata CBS 617.96]EXJ93963.1 hypothetical protein A1O1_02356 [Capronia coronata CBS 617.96]